MGEYSPDFVGRVDSLSFASTAKPEGGWSVRACPHRGPDSGSLDLADGPPMQKVRGARLKKGARRFWAALGRLPSCPSA